MWTVCDVRRFWLYFLILMPDLWNILWKKNYPTHIPVVIQCNWLIFLFFCSLHVIIVSTSDLQRLSIFIGSSFTRGYIIRDHYVCVSCILLIIRFLLNQIRKNLLRDILWLLTLLYWQYYFPGSCIIYIYISNYRHDHFVRVYWGCMITTVFIHLTNHILWMLYILLTSLVQSRGLLLRYADYRNYYM